MSIFTYGCEAWTLTEVLEAKVDAFEMWCFRRIAKISWKDKVTNNEVFEMADIESLYSLLKERRLR